MIFDILAKLSFINVKRSNIKHIINNYLSYLKLSKTGNTSLYYN